MLRAGGIRARAIGGGYGERMTARIGSRPVTPLCLGGNPFGWTSDHTTSLATLDAFVEGGGNFIDTADVYSSWVPGNSGGESERIIGAWLATGVDRGRLVLASKVAKHPRYRGLSAHNIRMALDGSRRRLGVDTIDLYYAHEDDEHVALEEWLGLFNALIAAGTIGGYGVSNFSLERTQAVLDVVEREGWARPVAVQPPYNLVSRRTVESGLSALAVSHKIGIVPYYGLASGFLTGKYSRGETARGARAGSVGKYFTDEGWAVLDAVVDIATELDCEPATVALAWLRSRPGVVAPIASASGPEQVPALLASATLKLGRAHVNRLDKASAAFAPAA